MPVEAITKAAPVAMNGDLSLFISSAAIAVYAMFNEWKRNRNTADRKTSIDDLSGKVELHKQELDSMKKIHASEIANMEDQIKNKTDLVLLEKEVFEEERYTAREEYHSTRESLIEGKMSVLKFDITQRFRDSIRHEHLNFTCPDDGGSCCFSDGFLNAQMKGYEAVLSDAFKVGLEVAKVNVFRNGYDEMTPTELEQRIINENKDVHRAIWEQMFSNFPVGLMGKPDFERTPESFTISYYREMIGAIMRAKDTERKKISDARTRYEKALRRIYGDRREVAENE